MNDESKKPRSDELNQLILDTLAEGVMACDMQGRILALNPAMIDIIFNEEDAARWHAIDPRSVNPEQLVQYFRVRDLEGRDLPLHRVPLNRTLAGERVRNAEVLLQPKGAPSKRLLVSGNPLYDEQGHQIGAVNVAQDITESVARDREARLALAMLNGTGDCAFRLHSKTLGFTYANQTMLELMKLSQDALSAHTLPDIVADDQKQELRERLDALAADPTGTVVLDLEIQGQEGTVPVEASLQYMQLAEGESCYIGLLRDLTARKRQQTQNLAAQRLEAIGNIAGGVAHDLNNVLTPVLIGLQMLRESGDKQEDLLTAIEVSAQRGAQMIQELLAFTRGNRDTESQSDVGRAVNEIRGIVEATFPKNIRHEVTIESDLPAVATSSIRVHQVLLNLCVNGRDAMQRGGTLSTTVRSVEVASPRKCTVGQARPGRYVELQVSDTGHGIEADKLETIFEPYFTTQPDGSGIGLATVKDIIEHSGGFLEVTSTPGQGTRFAANFPVAANGARAPASEPADTQVSLQEGSTVLFVDDEAMVRTTVEAMLKHMGFNPLTAMDGNEGLQLCREHHADLAVIITDTSMPGMDGVEFTAHLAEEYPAIPIVVCSGNLDPQVKRQFDENGVGFYLDKPFTRKDLDQVLGQTTSA